MSPTDAVDLAVRRTLDSASILAAAVVARGAVPALEDLLVELLGEGRRSPPLLERLELDEMEKSPSERTKQHRPTIRRFSSSLMRAFWPRSKTFPSWTGRDSISWSLNSTPRIPEIGWSTKAGPMEMGPNTALAFSRLRKRFGASWSL